MKIDQVILHTDAIAEMDRFYSAVLQRRMVAMSDGFHLYPEDGEVTIAAWQLGSPSAASAGDTLGGTELVVALAGREEVDGELTRLRVLGLTVEGPNELPFGYVITLIDPSGNHVRIGHFVDHE